MPAATIVRTAKRITNGDKNQEFVDDDHRRARPAPNDGARPRPVRKSELYIIRQGSFVFWVHGSVSPLPLNGSVRSRALKDASAVSATNRRCRRVLRPLFYLIIQLFSGKETPG